MSSNESDLPKDMVFKGFEVVSGYSIYPSWDGWYKHRKNEVGIHEQGNQFLLTRAIILS